MHMPNKQHPEYLSPHLLKNKQDFMHRCILHNKGVGERMCGVIPKEAREV